MVDRIMTQGVEMLPVEQPAWRCYHCGDVFTDDRCARLHFGRDEDSLPACQIKAGAEQGLLGALREAEYAAADAQQAIANECTDAAKAYYAQATRHAQALRNAEELGYERGLADARAEASPTHPAATGSVREALIAAVTRADASFGYSYLMTKMDDTGEEHTLFMDGFEPAVFEDRADGYPVIEQRRNALRADAILAALAAAPNGGAE